MANELENSSTESRYKIFCALFGKETIHSIPVPSRKPPHIFQISKRLQEKRIREAIGLKKIPQLSRDMMWKEIDKRQHHFEDAGGYMWRCWSTFMRYMYG